jgi:phage shock protein E
MFSIIKKVLGLTPEVNFGNLVSEGAQIVDVRSPNEFKGGHIKNSVNIPLQNLSDKLNSLHKDKVVIVCCASGMRSSSAKGILLSHGFSQVHNGGGWQGLQRKIIQKIGTFLFAMSIITAVSACEGKENKSQINLEAKEFSIQLSLKKDSVLLVDVRTPEEFNTGHILGAINIDYNGSSFAEGVAVLPKGKKVYVYCRSGGRSSASIPFFLKAGYKFVTNLEHGITGWEAAGLPVIVDSKK